MGSSFLVVGPSTSIVQLATIVGSNGNTAGHTKGLFDGRTEFNAERTKMGVCSNGAY